MHHLLNAPDLTTLMAQMEEFAVESSTSSIPSRSGRSRTRTAGSNNELKGSTQSISNDLKDIRAWMAKQWPPFYPDSYLC